MCENMIETRTRKVYYSKSKNRHYLTKMAAIKAEARALIIQKHPSEESEHDTGYQGWHWTQLPRSHVLYRRVVRLVKNHYLEKNRSR